MVFFAEIFIDYMHGTGHGVGHFLNVHEVLATIRCVGFAAANCWIQGPQGLGKHIAYNESYLKAGMTLSNGAKIASLISSTDLSNRAGILRRWQIRNSY